MLLDHVDPQVQAITDAGKVTASGEIGRFEQSSQPIEILRIQPHQPAKTTESRDARDAGKHLGHGSMLHAKPVLGSIDDAA
jgi:hypothetical protein